MFQETLRSTGRYALRVVVFCHRWTGLALCPFVILWFASGIVMMYSGFPEVSEAESLARAAVLNPTAIRVAPQSAYEKLGWQDGPGSADLRMLDDRPVYRFQRGGERALVFADTGHLLEHVAPELALRIAARFTGQPAAEAHFDGTPNDPDQWTVSGEYNAARPLLKFSWPDGEQVYVSAPTGEVVQHTTSRTRLVAYFGAIPHWLYWTPLRKNGRRWYKVVIWTSSALVCVSLLGLLIGVWSYSPRRRYRHRGQPTRVPYRGQKRWHMILGLFFGIFVCTWAFSGLLSMEPFDWLEGKQALGQKTADALRAAPIRWEAFAPRTPAAALEQAGLEAKEIEFVSFGGQPYYLAKQSPRVSRIVPVDGERVDQFETANVLRIVRDATQPARIEEARVVTSYDAYYLDRHGEHPLPALFVRWNDPAHSTCYIDLKTARIVEAYDRRSRWNRWLYHGLHSWNFPWLYNHRPAWDGLLILLLLGGLALGVTAVIIALRVLVRTLRFTARNSRKISTPERPVNLS